MVTVRRVLAGLAGIIIVAVAVLAWVVAVGWLAFNVNDLPLLQAANMSQSMR